MLIFDGTWRRQQTHSAGREHRLGISLAKWLHSIHQLVECRRHCAQVDFCVIFEARFQICGSQAGSRVVVELRAERADIRTRQRKSDRMRMSTVPAEKVAAGFERVEQVERANRTPGTVRFLAIA